MSTNMSHNPPPIGFVQTDKCSPLIALFLSGDVSCFATPPRLQAVPRITKTNIQVTLILGDVSSYWLREVDRDSNIQSKAVQR